MIGLPAGLLNIVFLGWFFGMQKTRAVMRDPIITEKSVLTKLSSDKSSEVISPKEQIPIREITFI